MDPVVIAGAGITGLTAADILIKHQVPVILIERENRVGGLARSFSYSGHTFDIGPHRFHTHVQHIEEYIREMLGPDILEIGRRSSVYFQNRYYSWPLRTEALLKMPWRLAFRCGLDLVRTGGNSNSKTESFENYVIQRYGRTLYELFFKQYTEKFAYVSCDQLHYTWAAASVERAIIDRRIRMNNLLDVFRMILMPRAVNTRFIYARGGNGRFSDLQQQAIERGSGGFRLGQQIEAMRILDSRITSIRAGGEIISPSWVIWTAPLIPLYDLLGKPAPGLRFMNTVLFNVQLSEPPLRGEQWIYFSARDIIFARVSNPSAFDPANIPESRGGLCVEIMCHEPGWWQNPAQLTRLIEQSLEQTGLIAPGSIADMRIEKVPDTYPIYTIEYPMRRAQSLKELKEIRNLIPAGRCGAFVYNNMDDSIAMGQAAAEQILSTLT